METLINSWEWDIFHIGAAIFCLLIAGAVGYIIYDSWFKNKKKVNGKR
jgi:hypothetical protein